ncbi:MAG: methyltransferase domain-containing protein [Magnetococcales bacterium]|nr:methyltransferase domain-containing protein [Magnetococcales bacterium]
MPELDLQEQFRPPDNLPPGHLWLGRVLFALRPWLDLQVGSVLLPLIPWLRGRRGKVLEVGCGAQPYRHFLSDASVYRCLDWSGAEPYFNYATPDTERYHGERFPVEDGWAEHVFHTEVLEHVWDMPGFLAECRRVMAAGGSLFFTIPFQARYHYIPHDYWRCTPAALERMLREAGFQDVQITSRGTDVTVAIYKVVSVVYRLLLSKQWVNTAIGIVLLPLLVTGLVLGQISLRSRWGSTDDTLGYVITASVASSQ